MASALPEPERIRFRLPAKRKLPPLDDADERRERFYAIINDSLDAARPNINTLLSTLDQAAYDRVKAAAKAEDKDVPTYMCDTLNTLAGAYAGYVTDEITIAEKETGADVTVGYIVTIVNEFSDMLGQHTAMQLYQTLTYELDTALDEQCGVGR